MISLSDLKPRVHSQQLGEFYSKLFAIFSADLNFDLNLPVRENNDDVGRDLLRVSFRYLREDSPPMAGLKLSFKHWADKRSHHALLPLHVLAVQAKKLEHWLEGIRDLVDCKRLVMDLGAALFGLDEVQDLRTSLCFLYLVHDKVHREAPNCPKWAVVQKEAFFSTYCTVVLLDDSSTAAGPSVASMFRSVLPETRQYLHRRHTQVG